MAVTVRNSVSPALAAKLRQLVDQLDAAAVRARRAADDAKGGLLTGAFQWLSGTDSAAAAVETAASGAATLARTIREKVERRITTDGEALDLLRDAVAGRWADLGNIEAVAASLTAAGAAREVGTATAKDVAKVAAWTVGWGLPLALVVVFLLAFGRPGRS